MNKSEYNEWLRGLIEQGRAISDPVDAAKPYVDAGDPDDEDELDDEDLDEDEEALKKGQKGAPPPGLSPFIQQILSGNVVWYDPATLAHDASEGLGKDDTMRATEYESYLAANDQFDRHCNRAAGIAQEMAQRLHEDRRESKDWGPLAANGLKASVRLNGMFTLLGNSLDPGHRALLNRLVDETQKDLDRAKDAHATRSARKRRTLAAMPTEFHRQKAQRSTLPALLPNTRSAPRQRASHNSRSGPAPRVVGYDADGVLLADAGEGRGVERVDGSGRGPLGRNAR